MQPDERKHYETPTSAEGFRGKFATHFFGLNIGFPAPKGRLPRNLNVESNAEGRVRALHYELWDSPRQTFDVLEQELSARLGAASVGRDGGREASWDAQGIQVRLRERMLDPGLKLSLDVTGVPNATENLDAVQTLLRDTFHELDNLSVSRTDPETLKISADLRGDDFAGVLVSWKGHATVDGGLDPALVDRVLEEIRHAQAEADDFEC